MTSTAQPERDAHRDAFAAAMGLRSDWFTTTTSLGSPAVAMASPRRGGYWAPDNGAVSSFGDAGFFGSASALTSTGRSWHGRHPDGGGTGWWPPMADLLLRDAHFDGSTGNLRSTSHRGHGRHPDGGGYWLVAADGGIFSFGDAHFYGSTGAMHSTSRWWACRHHDGGGYWLVASDGGSSPSRRPLLGSTGNLR